MDPDHTAGWVRAHGDASWGKPAFLRCVCASVRGKCELRPEYDTCHQPEIGLINKYSLIFDGWYPLYGRKIIAIVDRDEKGSYAK